MPMTDFRAGEAGRERWGEFNDEPTAHHLCRKPGARRRKPPGFAAGTKVAAAVSTREDELAESVEIDDGRNADHETGRAAEEVEEQH